MRCCPGDYALVIRTNSRARQLLGRLVIVERRPVPGEVLYRAPGVVRVLAHKNSDWVVRAANGGLLTSCADNGRMYDVPFLSFRDTSLWPIRPDELKGELETEDRPLTKETTK